MIGVSDSRRTALDDRQGEIEHDEIGATPAHQLECASAVAGDDHIKSGVPKIVTCNLGNPRLIVDDENRLHASFIRSCDWRCHSSNRAS